MMITVDSKYVRCRQPQGCKLRSISKPPDRFFERSKTCPFSSFFDLKRILFLRNEVYGARCRMSIENHPVKLYDSDEVHRKIIFILYSLNLSACVPGDILCEALIQALFHPEKRMNCNFLENLLTDRSVWYLWS